MPRVCWRTARPKHRAKIPERPPFTPVRSTGGIIHLSAAYWPFLAITLLADCLLTQFCKRLSIAKF
jgi:hypothetical protein